MDYIYGVSWASLIGHLQIEVEGTVEPGILGASWSPDDSLLVLVTGTRYISIYCVYQAQTLAQKAKTN